MTEDPGGRSTVVLEALTRGDVVSGDHSACRAVPGPDLSPAGVGRTASAWSTGRETVASENRLPTRKPAPLTAAPSARPRLGVSSATSGSRPTFFQREGV